MSEPKKPMEAFDLAIDTSGLDAGVPRLDEYFGVWAMEESRFRAAADAVAGMDLRAHVREARSAASENKPATTSLYQVLRGGIAVIALSGPLMKQLSSLSEGTSTVYARRQIRAAVADDDVASILLLVDSPGGTVAGTKDLADDVAAAARSKPVTALIQDIGASAAYWIASQASHVFANPTAMVGSIGTFAVIQDLSAKAAILGVKVHVVRAGAFKGSGVPGTEITAEQLGEWQRIVNELNDHFLAGVSAGRRMDRQKVEALADGRVHIGQAAVTMGLIDGVRSIDQVVAEMRKNSSARGRAEISKETVMDNPTSVAPAAGAERAATIGELKAEFPTSTAEFREKCLESGMTIAQATKAYLAETRAALDAERAKSAAAKQELEKVKASAAAAKPGVEPVSGRKAGAAAADAEGESGDAVADFDAAVSVEMKRGSTRHEAVARVAESNPVLHRNYLLATNKGKRARALIEDKFDEG